MIEAPVISGAAVREDYHTLVRTDLLPLVPPDAGMVLDVGATARYLKDQGRARKVGVIDMVAASEVDFAYAGDLERGDLIERAAAEHGPFDTILTLDILEHLVDPWAMVRRLHAALAPGGVIVASIPNVRHYTALAPLVLKDRWTYADEGILDRSHLRFFVESSAVQLLTSSGLALDIVERKSYAFSRAAKRVKRYSFGLLDGLFVFQFLIRVRKPA